MTEPPGSGLPRWPLTIDEVAERWHCGVRWLKVHAKQHGIGRRAGKVILIDEEEYRQLYASLETSGPATGQAVNAGMAAMPSAASELRAARRLVKEAMQKRKSQRRAAAKRTDTKPPR